MEAKEIYKKLVFEFSKVLIGLAMVSAVICYWFWHKVVKAFWIVLSSFIRVVIIGFFLD